MMEALAATADVPAPVVWAVVCVAVLVVEHVYALATPPYGLHVPLVFHLSFAGLYTWLGIEVCGHRKGQAQVHAAGVVLDGRV